MGKISSSTACYADSGESGLAHFAWNIYPNWQPDCSAISSSPKAPWALQIGQVLDIGSSEHGGIIIYSLDIFYFWSAKKAILLN